MTSSVLKMTAYNSASQLLAPSHHTFEIPFPNQPRARSPLEAMLFYNQLYRLFINTSVRPWYSLTPLELTRVIWWQVPPPTSHTTPAPCGGRRREWTDTGQGSHRRAGMKPRQKPWCNVIWSGTCLLTWRDGAWQAGHGWSIRGHDGLQ